MKGGITEVRNIEFDGYYGPRLSREMQRRRLMRVIDNELTEKQRRVVLGYYFEQKNICRLAEEYGVNKSSISRMLHRAEHRMKQYLKY